MNKYRKCVGVRHRCSLAWFFLLINSYQSVDILSEIRYRAHYILETLLPFRRALFARNNCVATRLYRVTQLVSASKVWLFCICLHWALRRQTERNMALVGRLRLDEVVSSLTEIGPTPPDGGYSWFVLCGVIFIQVRSQDIHKCLQWQ